MKRVRVQLRLRGWWESTAALQAAFNAAYDLMGDMTENRYERIREGLCPHGHGPLERCDDEEQPYGWCEQCQFGFWLTPDEMGLVIRVRDGGLVVDADTEEAP